MVSSNLMSKLTSGTTCWEMHRLSKDMRDDALEPADRSNRNMFVVDVGGDTSFTTLGIVNHVNAKNVTILDQSPQRLAKAKQKGSLKECKIV
ncbi:hypothetical protein VNO78_32969 [Psophocarpus tetragonolobus]|uniref:MPBQ/MBSQ family SAM-binding methyltransferase profile domain-containing protein n=1 Tax=Psophocarpus tetragonolobus TaxID=3891 RepID=A0AAN9P1A8_PSOTE